MLLTPPTPLSTYSLAASSSSHRPCSSRYLNANRWETGRVTLTLLVPLLRGFEPPPLPVHLVYMGGGPLPLKVRAFLDFAAPRLKATLEADLL